MAIASRTATWAGGGSATTVVPAEPSGCAADDILFFWGEHSAAASLSSGPTGWTLLNSWTTATFQRVHLWWIRRGSGALSATERTMTISASEYVEAEILAFSGCIASGNPYDDAQYAAQTTATNPDPPSATSSGADRMAVAFGMHWAGWTTGGATAPTNYTLTRTVSAGYSAASAYRAIGSGAENPAAFGNGASSDEVAAATVILTPASTATAVPVFAYHYKTQGIA